MGTTASAQIAKEIEKLKLEYETAAKCEKIAERKCEVKKRYPRLDTELFTFEHGLCISTRIYYGDGSPSIWMSFSKIPEHLLKGLQKDGILKTCNFGYKTSLSEEKLLKALIKCGWTPLFTCFDCDKFFLIEDLYVIGVGTELIPQTVKGEICCASESGRCRKCAKCELADMERKRGEPQPRKSYYIGGPWKGTYKLSDGGGGMYD